MNITLIKSNYHWLKLWFKNKTKTKNVVVVVTFNLPIILKVRKLMSWEEKKQDPSVTSKRKQIKIKYHHLQYHYNHTNDYHSVFIIWRERNAKYFHFFLFTDITKISWLKMSPQDIIMLTHKLNRSISLCPFYLSLYTVYVWIIIAIAVFWISSSWRWPLS